MQHGAYQQLDGRPALCFERRLSHPVGAAWTAVTDPAELAHLVPGASRDAAGRHGCLDALGTRLARETTDGEGDRRGLYAEYQRRGLPAGAPVPGP